MKNKVIVFDMDGTIADLYAVPNWLEKLRNEDVSPYIDAVAMYQKETLNSILLALKEKGYTIIVNSWASMDASQEYFDKIKTAKKEWLDLHSFPYDEIFVVPYGTDKNIATQDLGGFQIIVDDNNDILSSWKLGNTIDAKNDIIPKLKEILA